MSSWSSPNEPEPFAALVDRALAAYPVACLRLDLGAAPEQQWRVAANHLLAVAHGHDVALVIAEHHRLVAPLRLNGVHLGASRVPVREVRKAERAYTRAIAALEQQAATSLARLQDPALSGEHAVILLTYRDRLANLDAVIAEVHGFLGESPGHSGGHTVLLAAYKEKSEVLQEIIDLQLGEMS